MSDRIPGSSPFNPIRVGSWNIAISGGINILGFDWEYWHDDYDGAPDANDHRCGFCKTEADCRKEIAAWIEEHPDDA